MAKQVSQTIQTGVHLIWQSPKLVPRRVQKCLLGSARDKEAPQLSSYGPKCVAMFPTDWAYLKIFISNDSHRDREDPCCQNHLSWASNFDSSQMLTAGQMWERSKLCSPSRPEPSTVAQVAPKVFSRRRIMFGMLYGHLNTYDTFSGLQGPLFLPLVHVYVKNLDH